MTPASKRIAMWLPAIAILFASCSGGTTQNKTTGSDSTDKPRWVDPQKGKIWGKVNYVQIPLTALEYHLLGPVKSVRYVEYKMTDSGRVLDDSGYNVYDKAGHLVNQTEYDKNGKLKWHCTYGYDDHNHATEWNLNLPESKMLARVTFRYDANGNKTDELTVDTNKRFSRAVHYSYDDKGRMTEERMSMEGEKEMVSAYAYDSRGFQVSYTSLSNGKSRMKWTQEYDNNGNKLGGKYYKDDTILTGHWEAVLDKKGRDVERTDYKADGSKRVVTKRKYDDWDNITESIDYKPDGAIDTAGWSYWAEYVYDNNGNAVKETDYRLRNGKKSMSDLAERKFEYYQ